MSVNEAQLAGSRWIPVAFFALPIFFWGCLLERTSDHRVDALAAESVELSALNDLRAVYEAVMERDLMALSPTDREALRSRFEERALRPEQLRLRLTSVGTPRSIVAPGFRMSSSDLRVAPGSSPRVLADAFVERFAPIWRVTAADFAEAEVVVEPSRDRSNAGITPIVSVGAASRS